MAPISASEAKVLVEQIESIIHWAENSAEPLDESIRVRLGEAGLRLSLAMETPLDTVHRIGGTPLQGALAHVGIEKGIFERLAGQDNSGISSTALAQQTDIDPGLMKRLLRHYQSLGMVSQLGDDSFGPSKITKNLTSRICSVGVSFYFQVLSRVYLAVPQFLKEVNYKSDMDPNYCAWNIAHETSEPPWKWLQSQPQLAKATGEWMAVHRDGLPTFLDATDFEEFVQDTTDTTPLLVDVGGGVGHQCLAFRLKYPTIPGRVILQELDNVVALAESSPLPGFRDSGIEVQVHDFFTPQPIKGARAYYLRNILHNFGDDDSRKILEAIRGSMTDKSVVLIDEIVLSESGVPPTASQMDMSMLATQAARERTETEWKELLEEAGFSIVKRCPYSREYQDAILVASRK
ncbi:S-adenosyl-L-methionine-dependent methyltransferase [Nemania sp. NC0429]|nr:S-adenosyl-L-methionine-dependent methyltransferase [Nemania sp. NC0429]